MRLAHVCRIARDASPRPDRPGLRHLAFATVLVEAAARAILGAGGSR